MTDLFKNPTNLFVILILHVKLIFGFTSNNYNILK